MAILTKNDLTMYNNAMLGLGAPVTIDGQGYNQPDYAAMVDVNTISTYSQAAKACKIMLHYKNTQLANIADDLAESLKHYQAKVVEVVNHDNLTFSLSWPFDKVISDTLRTLDKSQFRWLKLDQWILQVKHEYAKEISDMFSKYGYDVSEIAAVANIDKLFKKKKIVVEAFRSDDSIDTIQLKSEYDANLIKIYKTIPGMYWDNKKQVWQCYIENAKIVFDKIKDIAEASSLERWANLVSSWETSNQLISMPKGLKFTPYKFQPEDAKKLLALKTGLNGNEVGCGKTFEQVLIGESIPMKKLVICPPTLRVNWMKEIQMVNPSVKVNIIYSNKEFDASGDWNIIGYQSIDKFQSQLEDENFQVIMIDEAHYIQAVNSYGQPSSKRAKGVLRLAATSKYVFPITGTPKTSRNKNLFNILRVIRHPLTRGNWAFANYGKKYCDGQRTQFGWDFGGNSNDQELNRILNQFMVRHLKKDVLPNIKKQRQAIPVDVNLKAYHKAIEDFLKKRGTNEALVALTKAKQVVAIQKAKDSIEFASDMIEQDKKVVIVTCYTEVVEQVMKNIKGCLKIVGGMSDKAKNEAIEQFQNGNAPAIVINVVAGGVGITLTASSTMIINDIPWTTGELEQAEGRIWRSGQKETAMVYYMMANNCVMDEKLINTIVYKSQTINDAIDGGAGEEIDLRKLLEESL